MDKEVTNLNTGRIAKIYQIIMSATFLTS